MTAHVFQTVLRRLRPSAAPPGGRPAADRELLDRFLTRRDQEAFAALVRRHERLVRSACRQVLGDGPDADDAFQAAFLVLLRKAAEVRWRPALGSWLYGVAHRVAVHA